MFENAEAKTHMERVKWSSPDFVDIPEA
jgi:hypothetical protein